MSKNEDLIRSGDRVLSQTGNRENLSALFRDCSDFLKTLREVRSAHFPDQQALFDAVHQLSLSLKELLDRGDKLQLISSDLLTKTGAWVGDDPEINFRHEDTKYSNIWALCLRKDYGPFNSYEVKNIAKHFQDVAGHLKRVTRRVLGNIPNGPLYGKGFYPASLGHGSD